MSNFVLLRGCPMDPSPGDTLAQFDSLAVGQPVPDGWRVLSGNLSSSEIARVVYRYEIEEES